MTTTMAPPPADTIGGRIAQARAYSRLTQHDIEVAVGVSRRTLSSWEHGKTSPTVEQLLRFADATGFQPAWFVEGLSREFGWIPGSPPPDYERYTQLSFVGGLDGSKDSPKVTSTEPAAA